MKRKSSTKAERRATLQSVGQLSKRLLAEETLRLYEASIATFYEWLKSEEKIWPEAADELDELLEEYVEHCWLEGDTRAEIANLLSALSHPVTGLARVSSHLRGAWRFYGLWVKLEKREKCLPIRRLTCRAIAGRAIAHEWYDMAFLFLLAFHCLLGTQEFAEARCADFEWSMCGTKGVLHLASSKSGKRNHVEEQVSVDGRAAAIVRSSPHEDATAR